ncbi:hypothetical protein SS37A_25810 [Methylocystis iwaonis]|uniref:Uncharacterized protein n=1 Tax=Methylocystis iwaonis TaxID=2885079 RepID=A0ABM8EAS9_9HYPH|nr:hypothetical protein SS37A_25810 [Methylocystis iwaonis]
MRKTQRATGAIPYEQLARGLVIPGGLEARPGIQSHKSAIVDLVSCRRRPRYAGRHS